MLGLELLRLWRVGPVAFKTDLLRFLSAQKMIVLTPVRLVADRACLPKHGLMQVCFLKLLALIRVARQARVDRVRLQKARTASGVRVVAGHTLALRAGMGHLGLVNFLDLLAMTGSAERLAVRVGQDSLAVLGRRMADFAGLVGKRRMREALHQLRLC